MTELTRRGFLTLGLKAAAAAIIAPAIIAPAIVRAESIMPVRGILIHQGNMVPPLDSNFLTIEQITRESLKILNQNLEAFSLHGVAAVEHTYTQEGHIRIRAVPPRELYLG